MNILSHSTVQKRIIWPGNAVSQILKKKCTCVVFQLQILKLFRIFYRSFRYSIFLHPNPSARKPLSLPIAKYLPRRLKMNWLGEFTNIIIEPFLSYALLITIIMQGATVSEGPRSAQRKAHCRSTVVEQTFTAYTATSRHRKNNVPAGIEPASPVHDTAVLANRLPSVRRQNFWNRSVSN